jgi:hypothetical protein
MADMKRKGTYKKGMGLSQVIKAALSSPKPSPSASSYHQVSGWMAGSASLQSRSLSEKPAGGRQAKPPRGGGR